jgi:trk system potassium uptake protein
LLDIRPVLFVNGFLLLILAAAMGVPMLVDLATDHSEWLAFAFSAMLTGFIGLGLIFANLTQFRLHLSTRGAFLLTGSSWLFIALFGAIPFWLCSRHLSAVDGLFETISGITTTGATVITGLDRTPAALLLWRALLQWLGGAGVIVTGVTLLPFLRIGGMQVFRLESSDEGRVAPRVSQVSWSVLVIYSLCTMVVAVALYFAGMTPLEAVCHAMSSLATGGFSTSDQSLGHFGEAARWVCVVGMLIGGATFAQYVNAVKHRRCSFLEDSQIRWYLAIIGVFCLLVTFWNWAVGDMGPYDAFSQSTFNVVSVLTTTGFHSADYSAWGGFAKTAFFMMAFIGGCTGSTAGGIKIFRYEVLFAVSGVQVRRLVHPHGVFPITFNQARISDTALRSVLGFLMVYFFCFMVLALALTVTGLDAVSGLSGAAAALANVGPGLGHVLGPSGSYEPLSAVAKSVLAIGMLVGRLELAPLLILFSRSFWQE